MAHHCVVKDAGYVIIGDNTTIVVNNQKCEEASLLNQSSPGSITNCYPPESRYYPRVALDKKIQTSNVKGKVQVLHGTIGTGKSSAALHFINNQKDTFVSWCVDCRADENDIHSSLFYLAKKLNVKTDNFFSKLFDAIKKKAEKENVIFLLDNYEKNQPEPTWLKELWMIKDSLHIIVTTNNASLNLPFPDVENTLVDAFDEAAQFLKEAKEASKENSEDDVEELCDHFSWNVLGLTSAKLYITDMKISIQNYLEMLRNIEAAHVVRKTEETIKTKSLYAAVQACVENIDKHRFPALAVLAVIGHDRIPEFLLSSVFSATKSAPVKRAYLDGLHTSLLLKSLVHITNENQVRFFSFHQFTQSVVFDLLSKEEGLRKELVYTMAVVLVKYFNKDNRFRKDAFMLNTMAHHAEVFLGKWKEETKEEIKKRKWKEETKEESEMDRRILIAFARLSELVGFAYTQMTQRSADTLDSAERYFTYAQTLLHDLCEITDDDLKDMKCQENQGGNPSPLGITDSHKSIAQHLFKKLSEKSSNLSISTIHELAFSRPINSTDLSVFPKGVKDNINFKNKVNSFEPLSEEDVKLLVSSSVAYCAKDYAKLFLPELYVSLLYSFGRNYFYFLGMKQPLQQPSSYVDRLKLAYCIAREITKRMNSGEHAVMHEYLTQSNALLYFLINREVIGEGGGLKGNKEHRQDFKNAIDLYRVMMQEKKQFFEMGILKKKKDDKFSQMVCLSQVVQCYKALVSPEMTTADDERDQLIQDGAKDCERLLALVYALQTTKDAKGKVAHQQLQQFSKFLNVVGDFYLATNRNDLLRVTWRLFIDSAGNAEVNESHGQFYVQALVGLADFYSRSGEQCFAACKMSNLQLKYCSSMASCRQVFCQQQPRVDEIKKRNTRTILNFYWKLWRQAKAVPLESASLCQYTGQGCNVTGPETVADHLIADSIYSDGGENNTDVHEQAKAVPLESASLCQYAGTGPETVANHFIADSTCSDGGENNPDVQEQASTDGYVNENEGPYFNEDLTNRNGSSTHPDVAEQGIGDLPLPSTASLSEKEMQDLAKMIPDKWKPLARYLTVYEEKIKEIEINYQRDVNEQAYQMLWFWSTHLAVSCQSWRETLGKALCNDAVGRNDLAKTFADYSQPDENDA